MIYFKIPQKISSTLIESINKIKNEVESVGMKEEAKNILSDYEKIKLAIQKTRLQMINKANEDAEKIIVKTNEEFHTQMENRKRNTEVRINK